MNLSYLARTVKLPPHPYCKAGYLVYKDKGIVIMKTAPRKRFYCVAYKVSVNALLIPYIPDYKNPKRLFFNREQDCFIIRLYASMNCA